MEPTRPKNMKRTYDQNCCGLKEGLETTIRSKCQQALVHKIFV